MAVATVTKIRCAIDLTKASRNGFDPRAGAADSVSRRDQSEHTVGSSHHSTHLG